MNSESKYFAKWSKLALGVRNLTLKLVRVASKKWTLQINCRNLDASKVGNELSGEFHSLRTAAASCVENDSANLTPRQFRPIQTDNIKALCHAPTDERFSLSGLPEDSWLSWFIKRTELGLRQKNAPLPTAMPSGGGKGTLSSWRLADLLNQGQWKLHNLITDQIGGTRLILPSGV